MAKIYGREITKNTVVGVSLGTLVPMLFALWAISGLGRPLFASDLKSIEEKIDTYQASTAIQMLNIRKSALQSELRTARRDARENREDTRAQADVDFIEDQIEDVEDKILCHRTKGCTVEDDV